MTGAWQACKLDAAFYNGERIAAPFRFSTIQSERVDSGKLEAVKVRIAVWKRPNIRVGDTGTLEVVFLFQPDAERIYNYPRCQVTAHGVDWYPVEGKPHPRKGFWVEFTHNVERTHGY